MIEKRRNETRKPLTEINSSLIGRQFFQTKRKENIFGEGKTLWGCSGNRNVETITEGKDRGKIS